MGADYSAPVVDVWPTWPHAPRLAFVLVSRRDYDAWVVAVPQLSALSGRRVRVFRAATPPAELVRQALPCPWPVADVGRAIYAHVPPDARPPWYATYSRVLPLAGRLVGRPVVIPAPHP
jgi:hypothetical protein